MDKRLWLAKSFPSCVAWVKAVDGLIYNASTAKQYPATRKFFDEFRNNALYFNEVYVKNKDGELKLFSSEVDEWNPLSQLERVARLQLTPYSLVRFDGSSVNIFYGCDRVNLVSQHAQYLEIPAYLKTTSQSDDGRNYYTLYVFDNEKRT